MLYVHYSHAPLTHSDTHICPRCQTSMAGVLMCQSHMRFPFMALQKLINHTGNYIGPCSKDFLNCDPFPGLDIKPEKSILGLLHILIVDILKSVFPKSDVCRTKIRFLANFQGPSVMQIEL